MFYTIQSYNALHLPVDFNSLLVLKFKLGVLTNKKHLKYSFILCITIGFNPTDIIDAFGSRRVNKSELGTLNSPNFKRYARYRFP